MVTHYLDFARLAVLPNEANPILVVYPYRMLPFPIPAKRFEAITRGNHEIQQLPRKMYLSQLLYGISLKLPRKSLRTLSLEQPPTLFVREALYAIIASR